LNLPKLPIAELNEAISWQAQEYLPTTAESLIIDWKIIEKSENSIGVLIVAIPKDILMDYVSACELAGLFPSAVQTPSVCLTNLIKESEGGSLIVYVGENETIFVFTEKDKILGTSVLGKADAVSIGNTASRMVSHFGKKDFKSLFVGGPKISQHMIEELKSSLKISPTLISPKISGLDEQGLQEMLVPISLQMGDLTEPSDPNTLNLLPNNLVDKYRIEKMKIQMWSLTLTTTFFVWVSFILVLGSYLVMMQQIADLKVKNLENLQISQTRNKYQNEAKKINDTVNKILKIKTATVVPEEVLNQIWGQKPPGVNIISYKMDFQKGSMVLNGVSVDRTSLINFEKNLEAVPEITQVTIPISSFEKETDLEFQLSFQYTKNLPLQQLNQIKAGNAK
jgi:Tfp pilus assembly protein PilN